MLNLITSEAAVVTADEKFSASDRLDLLAAAYRFKLTPSEFRLYFYLVNQVDSNRSLSRTIEQMTDDCGVKSQITIRRLLDALLAMGIIRRLPNNRSYTYCLTDPLDWVERDTAQKLTDQKLKGQEEQQDSKQTPLGGLLESAACESEEGDQKLTRSQNNPVVPSEPEPQNLQNKLDAARARGWVDAGSWWDDCNQQMVRVNCYVVSLQEFMKRSLDSFNHVQEHCKEGIAMVKAQLEKIKRRSQQKRFAFC